MSKELILLFSSNWEALYAQNAIDLTASPEGSLVHFRYQSQWLAPSFGERIQNLESRRKLIGSRILCLFVDRTVDIDVPLIVPTRFGILLSLEKLGDVWHLYFTVDSYFDWQSFQSSSFATERSWESLDKTSKFIWSIRFFGQVLRAELNPGSAPSAMLTTPPDKWATICDPQHHKIGSGGTLFPEGSSTTSDVNWENLILAFHTLPYFSDTIFYRLKSVDRFVSPWETVDTVFGLKLRKRVKAVQVAELIELKYGYLITQCQPQRLTLVVANGKDLSPKMKRARIEIGFQDSVFLSERERIDIEGKYDVHRIIIFPVFGSPDILSPMNVRTLTEPDIKDQGDNGAVKNVILNKEVDDRRKAARDIWIDISDRNWAAARRTGRIAANKRVSNEFPKGIAPAGPKIEILWESSHSKRYLRIGGCCLLVGFLLGFCVTPEMVRALSSMFSNLGFDLTKHNWARMWLATSISRFLGALLIYAGFVVATRKLPTLK